MSKLNKYLLIEKGSRGMIEDVLVVDSLLELKEFCEELYKSKINDMKEGLNEEELKELDVYLEEFGGVGDLIDGMIEVGWSEEEWYEVYKVVK